MNPVEIPQPSAYTCSKTQIKWKFYTGDTTCIKNVFCRCSQLSLSTVIVSLIGLPKSLAFMYTCYVKVSLTYVGSIAAGVPVH